MTLKEIKTTIVLAFLAGLGILGYTFGNKWYSNKYGVKYCYDLSENLTVIVYNNGEIGIENNSTEKIVGRYNRVLRTSIPDESAHCIRIVIKDNLRGYISAETGEVIFEPQFLYAWIDDPESGLAACVNKDHKLGFVNVKTKQVAIPFQFDFDKDLFISFELPIFDFVFNNGICIVPGKGGKIGMIDTTGKLLLPAEYIDIINWRDATTPNIILKRKSFITGIGIHTEYCNGYVKIQEVIKGSPAFFQGDLKANDIILKVKQGNDKDYENVFNKDYENVLNLIRGDKGTKVTLLVKHENGSTQDVSINRDKYVYGVCDRNFKMTVPFEYNNFEKNAKFYFDEYKWKVKNYIVSKDGKYGILDTLFNTILPTEYDNIEIRENSYIVKLNKKYGVLDNNFKPILPVEFDWINTMYTDNNYDNYTYLAKKDYAQKLYDGKGKILNDFYIDYDSETDIEVSVFEPVFEPSRTELSGYIKYYLDGYYGIIDDARRIVIPAKYDKIEYLGNRNFSCTKNEYSILIKDK
jgi:hypothetical protein